MRLDAFRAEARLRSGWETVDLGIVMARQWFFPLFLLWAVPVSLVYLALTLFFWDKPWMSVLIIWWFKPLWERPLLFYASRALFGEVPSVAQLVSHNRSWLWADILPWLLWRRLSPSRSFDMPVSILEQLRSTARTRRLQVLHRRFTNEALWSTVGMVHIEAVVSTGLLALLYLMLPAGIEVDLSILWSEGGQLFEHVNNFLAVLAMASIAPFYVCAGFALYLQRRMDLEGWDIEIRFRELAARRRRPRDQSGRLMLGLLVMLSVALWGASPSPSVAAENALVPIDEVPSDEALESRKRILDILAGADFRNITRDEGWRFRESPEEASNDGLPDWLIALVEWLESLWGGEGDVSVDLSVAKVIEALLWILVISLVVMLLIRYRGWVRKILRRRPEARPSVVVPETLFGMDVRKESLPEDLLAEARAAWQAGAHREAMGCLMRGTLVRLVHDHQCRFSESDTERECVWRVERQCDPDLSGYFAGLVKHWLLVAYAHRDVAPEAFEELCAGWQQRFPDV